MRIIYLIFVLAGGILFLGSSSGPGNIQGKDRTGGPLSDAPCSMCHGAGAFNPSLDVKILKNGTEVAVYEAGTTYTLQVTINADNGAQVYGFQATALSGVDNVQAGSFMAGIGTQTVSLSGREYIEHSTPNQSNVFEVEWTAPESVGDVSFYVGAIAANSNGTSGGDGATRLLDPVVLSDGAVATNDLPKFADKFNAFPNPVATDLNIHLELGESKTGTVSIVNAAGQVLRSENQFFHEGLNTLSYDMSDLPAGNYWLEIANENGRSTMAVLKK